MMKKLMLVTAALLLGLLMAVPEPSRAQPHLGVYTGYATNFGEPVLGVEGQLHLGETSFLLNPALETYVIEEGTSVYGAGNVVYRFGEHFGDGVVPYVGPGVAVQYFSQETELTGNESDVDLGLNVLGGVYFWPARQIHPYVETRYTILEDNYFSVLGGIMFTL